MSNKVCLLVCVVIFGIVSRLNAQITKEFMVNESGSFNLVKLDFSSYKGVSNFKRELYGRPLTIHAHLGKVNILPTFSHQVQDNILSANLEHKNIESENLGKSLSHRLFSNSNENFDHSWYVGLDANYLYNLNLNFGIGKANLDLSYLPVANCKIQSATADISLHYSNNIANSVNMDTMMVTINMGSVYAEKVNLSNAKNMVFDINYGSVNLTFDKEMPSAANISAMVGAGSVNIELPAETCPYIIYIKSTAMCRTSIPSYLKSIGNKTYVSKGYRKDANNLMTFLIDVSVGTLSLQ